MKMNKEQFLKTEFGGELESTITAWDDALSRNREDKEVLRTLAWKFTGWRSNTFTEWNITLPERMSITVCVPRMRAIG